LPAENKPGGLSLMTQEKTQDVDMGEVRRCFARDRFAAANGVELLELRPGYAKAKLEIEQRHLNGVDIVQGGAIFTLADFAFAVACNTSGRVAVAVNTNLSFLKATRGGSLYAEAVEVSRSKRISTCTVRISGDDNEPVALFQGTAYIKDEKFPLVVPPSDG
jgi:acyl-CoA thioesterase